MRPDNFAIPIQPCRASAAQLAGGLLLALAAGLLFALGLVLSGMTQPAKVIGFLNLAGMAQAHSPAPGTRAWPS